MEGAVEICGCYMGVGIVKHVSLQHFLQFKKGFILLQIAEGFDIIELPKCKYMLFQGEPFAEEKEAISNSLP